MEFIPSPRSNKQLLVFEGHIESTNKIWPVCYFNRRNKNACNARIKTLKRHTPWTST